ncbi:MAG: helix-turn-helix transcriptional regulator [Lactobacillaceae bacterium]|jgi:transcriptional regulator with XRE-family HTH domain|nr:helix-turn-helix transcriptional regulator [Lactobacillaceae bacterium]
MPNELIPFEIKHSVLDLRVRAGLSQAQAAARLGISEPTLRKWENDSSVLSYKDMLRISKLYGVPLDYIFFGPNNAFSEITKQ